MRGGAKMGNPIERLEQYLKDLEEQGDIFDPDERACRICGCTQMNACPCGCYWLNDDLCSQCLKYSGTDIDPMVNECL